jgi:hypothetical protein
MGLMAKWFHFRDDLLRLFAMNSGGKSEKVLTLVPHPDYFFRR